MPAHTRRAPCPSYGPCLSHADSCFKYDVVPVSPLQVRKRAAVPGQVDKAVGALFLGTLLKIIRGDSFNGVMYSLNELKRIINEIQYVGRGI